MTELDDSPQAREEFFLQISLIKGRPMGLGSAQQRNSTMVGSKAPRPGPVPEGHINAARNLADFSYRAGRRGLALPTGKVEDLYREYLEWYARQEKSTP